MSNRTIKKVHRSNSATTRFGDDKASGGHQAKNHTAGVNRTMTQLRGLLCLSGEKTNGEACRKCTSPCRFGEEYLEREKSEHE